MDIGDPFVVHTAYCLQVLQGLRKDEFNEQGVWPTSEPAVMDEPSQEVLVGQLRRWKDLVKRYIGASKQLDPREMFILAVALQRWPGPVIEVGTHKGILTCFMAEVMNLLMRNDMLYTVELYQEGVKAPDGTDDFPGDAYLQAIHRFRSQKPLARVIPIVGDTHKMRPIYYGIRPTVIFLDADHSAQGIGQELEILKFFNYPFICLIHDANINTVMTPILDFRYENPDIMYANFHTGQANDKGLVALARF